MNDAGGDVGRELGRSLTESYAVNERMNQIILEALDPAAWRARPDGGQGRTIAGIFTHVHNVRRKWIRLSAAHLGVPGALNRVSCTQEEARLALAESGGRCWQMISEALSRDGKLGELRSFRRDGWAKAWPAGGAMVAYMMTHDAHHRGQVCLVAHQLGFPLPDRASQGIWVWERLWKESGLGPPR